MTPDVNVVISHSEYTVLVVDDVVSNVLLLKVLLTNEKFKVITAARRFRNRKKGKAGTLL